MKSRDKTQGECGTKNHRTRTEKWHLRSVDWFRGSLRGGSVAVLTKVHACVERYAGGRGYASFLPFSLEGGDDISDQNKIFRDVRGPNAHMQNLSYQCTAPFTMPKQSKMEFVARCDTRYPTTYWLISILTLSDPWFNPISYGSTPWLAAPLHESRLRIPPELKSVVITRDKEKARRSSCDVHNN